MNFEKAWADLNAKALFAENGGQNVWNKEGNSGLMGTTGSLGYLLVYYSQQVDKAVKNYIKDIGHKTMFTEMYLAPF